MKRPGAGEGNRIPRIQLGSLGFLDGFKGHSWHFSRRFWPIEIVPELLVSEGGPIGRLIPSFLPATDIVCNRASKPINRGRGQTGFHLDVDERGATKKLFLQERHK